MQHDLCTQDDSNKDVPITSDKPVKSVPLLLPDQTSYTTHRAVTPLLPASEKISHKKLDQSYGYSEWELSSLKASEGSQASIDDFSPVHLVSSDSVSEATSKEFSEDFTSFPEFNRVISEFEKTVPEFESEENRIQPKDIYEGPGSPHPSDSDLEFFDCQQTFSDFSEAEDVNPEQQINFHVTEPLSPTPTPDVNLLRQRPQNASHHLLRVEDYKHFSSCKESSGELAYDSEGSWECQTDGDHQTCEELPSRGQAGYYDDDEFLGRVRVGACVKFCTGCWFSWLVAVVDESQYRKLLALDEVKGTNECFAFPCFQENNTKLKIWTCVEYQ